MREPHDVSGQLTDTRIKKILLTKKYRQFFVPSLMAAAALSLSEFADSIVVSNLLDTRALSIVNVCTPLVTMMAAVYLMLSVGGVGCYTERRGRSDYVGAARVFTVCFVTALAVGLILLAIGQLFTRGIGTLLCPGLILGEELLSYIRVLLLSMPFLIPVSVVLYFLTAAGSPKLSMALNVLANVLNLVLDYVYIRICNMGVTGAAAATLTSYLAAGALLVALKSRYDLRLVRISPRDYQCMPAIMRRGLANSLTQIGFSIKFGYCNVMAASLGGSSAITAMSLFQQAVSIISIVVCGAMDTILPFITLLRTQHDYDGASYILKRALGFVAISSVAFVATLEICPTIITAMYNVTSPDELSLAITAIRITSICFLFRSVCMVFMEYVATLGLTPYATYISLFDGFVGIVAIGCVLSSVFGLTGLWMTFPVDALLLLCSIAVINGILCKRHPERFAGLLLTEKDAPGVHTLDLAIEDDDTSIAYVSEKAVAFCGQNGVPEKLAQRIGLIAEETALYIRMHIQSQELLNMLLQKKGNNMWLYFRSIGEQYDLSSFTENDVPENYRLLKALIPDYQYNYTMGMNNLRVKFKL